MFISFVQGTSHTHNTRKILQLDEVIQKLKLSGYSPKTASQMFYSFRDEEHKDQSQRKAGCLFCDYKQ